MPRADELMPTLVREFPAFEKHWEAHVQYWEGKPPGLYLDMAEFVHFVVDDLYASELIADVRHAFEIMEQWLVEGDKATADIVVLGFFETLQCYSSWQPFGEAAFEEFLGEKSRAEWDELKRVWARKDSLMDIVRAERESEPDS